MKLNDWLAKKAMRPNVFAATLCVPASTVSRWLSGKRYPSPLYLAKIHEATSGAVTPNDFMLTREAAE